MHVSAAFQIFCITLGLISLGQSEVIDISEIPLVETCPPVGLTYLATNTTTLKYFYYSTERLTFFGAMNYCRRQMFMGKRMDLASFDSKDEHLMISNAISNNECDKIRGWSFWVGLNVMGSILTKGPLPASAWSWVATGNPMAYEGGWHQGEPNRVEISGQYESCAAINRPSTTEVNGFYDFLCTSSEAFICQASLKE